MKHESEHLLGTTLSRRQVLRYGALGGLSVATVVLLSACGGDDDDDDADPTATSAGTDSTPEAGASPTAGEQATGEPKPGGTLVWGMGGDADALDPHTTNAWAAWRQATMMYESLVRKDLLVEEGTPEIVPLLAEKWELSDDGLTWTFTLRQGVTFHDGSDFNAAAVQANYERNAVADSEYFYSGAWHGGPAFRFVTSTEMPDDYTFVFTHSEVVGEFLPAMGDYYWFGIASPTKIKEVGNENLAANPSGTGPFRFVERIEGERTVFERNEDYWGEKAWVDRLIVRPILEDQARVIALQTGEIDIMSDPPPDLIQQLVDEGYKLSQGPASQVAYYWFQHKNEFASNVLVRQAISYALDRETIARDLFRDTVIPAYGVLTPGSPAYDPDWAPTPFDPEKAKELLAEAGYPDGFSTKVAAAPTASGWPQAGATAQLIQSNLKDVGIEVELELTEWVSYLGIPFRDRTDLLMYGTAWGMPTHFFLNIIFESTFNTEASTFDTGYNNVENPKADVDEILQAAARETDPQKAIDLYRQANEKICITDQAVLPINHDKFPHLMKANINGFIHAVNVNYDMSKVWIDS